MPLDNRLLDRVALDRELVRRKGLRQFAELAWPIIRSETFKSNWHIDLKCDVLGALFDREFRKCIISEPPGSMKTLLASVLYPAWTWTVDPSESFIFASFDQGLMDQAAREHRNIVSSSWFQARWPNVKLTGTREGGTSAREFRNTAKGWRFSTSVGGKGTGRHPNQRVIDDPIKPKDTEGSAEATRGVLLACENWYNSTIATRQADPKTTIDLLIMQRLHDADLTGKLKAKWGDDVCHVMLPMEYESARSFSFSYTTTI